jgi:hypothetical protein
LEAALDPQAFGQVLNRIWRLMRPHIGLFIAIGAVPMAVMVVVYALMVPLILLTIRMAHPPIGAAAVTMIVIDCLAGVLFLAILLLMFALFEPAASYAGLELTAERTVTFRQSYGVALSKPGRYFWLAILRALITSGPMIVPLLIILLSGLGLAAAGKNAAPGWAFMGILLGVLLYLGAMVWALLATIRLVLAYPACIAENLTAGQAIRRSNRLSQGGRLRIFLVGLVLYAVTYAATLVLEVVIGIVAALGMVFVAVLHLSQAWLMSGAVLVGICLLCLLLLLTMVMSSSYSVAFAILYREHVRMESMAMRAPGAGV